MIKNCTNFALKMRMGDENTEFHEETVDPQMETSVPTEFVRSLICIKSTQDDTWTCPVDCTALKQGVQFVSTRDNKTFYRVNVNVEHRYLIKFENRKLTRNLLTTSL
jgi:hypothetical protein